MFGGESGSDETLAFIKKDINTQQIIESIKMCKQAGLKSFTSFMIGFPGETDEEMMKTLDMYDRIVAIDPEGARINGMFIYTPFLGIELFDTVVKSGGICPLRVLTNEKKWSFMTPPILHSLMIRRSKWSKPFQPGFGTFLFIKPAQIGHSQKR